MGDNKNRLRLPIGIQNFRKIREEGFYYVDKTPFALDLVAKGSYYFLSRPRRFGKSLFLDTLAELFAGSRELFSGLHAENNWDWSQKYPVIRISFSEGRVFSREELKQRIRYILKKNADAYGLEITENTDIAGEFEDLIKELSKNYSQRVVVLVDEYDKPILDNIEDRKIATEMREELKNLYSVLKGLDAFLHFVFITGVSKFSKVSLFSGLNNLTDITLDSAYASICGYTEQDVMEVFAPELGKTEDREALDLEQMRLWYNGYNWLGESVYNPYDLLHLFRTGKYMPWWYETGTPSFLLKILRERQVFIPDLGRMIASSQLLSTFDVDNIPTESLLWQTGYLTIEEEIVQGASRAYRLKYPNLEVSLSLNEALLLDWVDDSLSPLESRSKLYQVLVKEDFVAMGEVVRGFYASIPHQWFTKNPLANYEGYYASVFYAFFASIGLDIVVEESSNSGRLDMAVKMADRVILFEFKLVQDGAEGSALRQIQERGYAEKYRGVAKAITLVGVEFSKARRSLVGWEVKEISVH